MTVLVTGATGFVGRHLAAHLVASGIGVRAALRSDAGRSLLPDAVEPFVGGDLAGEIDWRPALRGVDAVVHLAAIAHIGESVAPAQYERINHHAAVRIAQAARATAARVVFVSSVRAQCGPTAAGVLSEDTPAQPTDPYGRAKLAAERDIAALGGPHVVLRPTVVYGPGVGGNIAALVRLCRLPVPLPFGAVANRRSLLAVENLCGAITLALTSEAALSGTFLVADRETVSLADMVRHLRAGMGRSAATLPVPPALLRSALRMIGRGALWDRLAGDLAVSTKRIDGIGYAPTVSTPAGLARLAAMRRRAQ